MKILIPFLTLLLSVITGCTAISTGGGGGLGFLTNKADIPVFNGTNAVRFPGGADGQFLKYDSSTPTGLSYGAGGGGATSGVTLAQFNLGNLSTNGDMVAIKDGALMTNVELRGTITATNLGTAAWSNANQFIDRNSGIGTNLTLHGNSNVIKGVVYDYTGVNTNADYIITTNNIVICEDTGATNTYTINFPYGAGVGGNNASPGRKITIYKNRNVNLYLSTIVNGGGQIYSSSLIDGYGNGKHYSDTMYWPSNAINASTDNYYEAITFELAGQYWGSFDNTWVEIGSSIAAGKYYSSAFQTNASGQIDITGAGITNLQTGQLVTNLVAFGSNSPALTIIMATNATKGIVFNQTMQNSANPITNILVDLTNTASAANSKAFSLRVGNVYKLNIGHDGALDAAGAISSDGGLYSKNQSLYLRTGNTDLSGLYAPSAGVIGLKGAATTDRARLVFGIRADATNNAFWHHQTATETEMQLLRGDGKITGGTNNLAVFGYIAVRDGSSNEVFRVKTDGSLTITGTNYAAKFSGDGSLLTGLASGVAVAAGTNITAQTNGSVVTVSAGPGLVTTNDVYSASDFTNAVTSIGDARYQGTNAALTRLVLNQVANYSISNVAITDGTNYWVDFAYPSQTLQPTGHVCFFYATNLTTSASINNFTDVTVYNEQATDIIVTFSSSFKSLGVVSNTVTPGKHLQIPFMSKRSTDQTNVSYATVHCN